MRSSGSGFALEPNNLTIISAIKSKKGMLEPVVERGGASFQVWYLRNLIQPSVNVQSVSFLFAGCFSSGAPGKDWGLPSRYS